MRNDLHAAIFSTFVALSNIAIFPRAAWLLCTAMAFRRIGCRLCNENAAKIPTVRDTESRLTAAISLNYRSIFSNDGKNRAH
jgi:hypothetical protein